MFTKQNSNNNTILTRKTKKMADRLDVAHLQEKTKLILKSRKNANLIVDLLVSLDGENGDCVLKAISGLKRVFLKYIGKRIWHQVFEAPTGTGAADNVNNDVNQFQNVNDPKTESAGDSSNNILSKDSLANNEIIFAKWVHEKYLDFIRKLLRNLQSSEETRAQQAALNSLMELLFADHKAIVTSTFQKLKYYFPNTLFYKIINHMLSGVKGQEDLIEYFKNQYLDYDDIQFYCGKNLQSIISAKIEKINISNSEISFTFAENVYLLLKSISSPKEDKETLNLFINTNVEKSMAQNILSSKECSKNFSSVWLSFLRLPLPLTIQKKVLVNLHSEVMPFLEDPKLLIDFLVDSYNVTGATSLLALNGLFILIHQYNLDYPEFYHKLYNLFDASIFHSKYKDRFFHLSDLFLSSTHLPSYLVAAFMKRLARLSLTAPPDGIRIIVVFIENLLKRHPSCKCLIQKKQKHPENAKEMSYDIDPYLFDEEDPAKCNALKSSLWELKTLQIHYLSDIIKAIDIFYKPFQKEETDVSDYFDTNYSDLFDKQCANYDENRDVPLAFQSPATLFDDTMFSQEECNMQMY